MSSEDGFRAVLLKISGALTREKLEELKFCFVDDIPKGKLQDIHKGHELFVELETSGLLSENNTSNLEECLGKIGEDTLQKKLKNFRKTPVEQGQDDALDSRGRATMHPGFPCEVRNFKGRDKIVNEIVAAVTSLENPARLLILKAPPGFGKSSVAKHVGHCLIKGHNIYVVFVCLRGLCRIADACTAVLRLIDGHTVALSDDVVLQTQNRLTTLKRPTLLILDNAEDLQRSDSGADFAKLLRYLRNHSQYLHICLTSRQDMEVLLFDYELNLPSLSPPFAAELLIALTEGPQQIKDRKVANELAIQCGSVPLSLELAAKLVKTGYDPQRLAKALEKNLYGVLEGFPRVRETISFFLKSFNEETLISLVKLANFSATFRATDAEIFFRDYNHCSLQLCGLYANALIQMEGEGYSLHPIIQTFCREEHKQLACEEEGKKAEEIFVEHFIEILKKFHTEFVGKSCQEALREFDRLNMDIKQAYKICLDRGTKEMKEKCIDACNDCINLLGKVLQPDQCHELYQRLHNEAIALEDEKRASECLVSLGFRHMCDKGHREFSEEAFDAFTEAYEILKRLPKHKRATEVYAHCCSKLGVCHLWNGDRQTGKALIEEGIMVRRQLGEQVLMGASYCDKAAAARICGEHSQAINILLENTLPIYSDHLGDHPWVATIHSYISDSHEALGKTDDAVKHRRLALEIRKRVLGPHQDTARGHVHLGKMLNAEGRIQEALVEFQAALAIQEEVLGLHPETTVTCRLLAGILEKLGRTEEAELMRNRVASDQKSHEERQTNVTQISNQIKERTRSISCKGMAHNMKLLVPMVCVLVCILAVGIALFLSS